MMSPYALDAVRGIKCVTENIPVYLATEEAMQKFLQDDGNYLIIALYKEKVVGFIVSYELQRIDREQKMMFLYEITVLNDYRRMGVGTALVEFLKETCTAAKMMKMFVPTETTNFPATSLYKKTGGIQSASQDEVFFTWRFNEI